MPVPALDIFAARGSAQRLRVVAGTGFALLQLSLNLGRCLGVGLGLGEPLSPRLLSDASLLVRIIGDLVNLDGRHGSVADRKRTGWGRRKESEGAQTLGESRRPTHLRASTSLSLNGGAGAQLMWRIVVKLSMLCW